MTVHMGTAASSAPALRAPSLQPRDPGGSRDHLRVAPDVRRRRLRARLLMVAIALVTVASLFTLVGFRVVAAQSSFALDRLTKERTNEQLRYERLREDVARRSSPASVIAAARHLGMVDAPKQAFISAPSAGTHGPAQSATPPALAPTSYESMKKALDQNP
jgi:hypothetical protein